MCLSQRLGHFVSLRPFTSHVDHVSNQYGRTDRLRVARSILWQWVSSSNSLASCFCRGSVHVSWGKEQIVQPGEGCC